MSVRINNVLEYQGAAMPVFSLAPSWRASPGFSARAEAETVVSESLSGAEYRAQRRPRPFWRLRFEAISHDARESGYARRVVQLGADLPVAVPYWPHRVELTAEAAAEATSISHEDTGDTIWADARYALIWADALNWEVVELDGEAGATATDLAEALEESWPAGASLVPLLVGHFERGAGATHETDELGVWMVDFNESPVEALGVTEVHDLDGIVLPEAVLEYDASDPAQLENESENPPDDDDEVVLWWNKGYVGPSVGRATRDNTEGDRAFYRHGAINGVNAVEFARDRSGLRDRDFGGLEWADDRPKTSAFTVVQVLHVTDSIDFGRTYARVNPGLSRRIEITCRSNNQYRAAVNGEDESFFSLFAPVGFEPEVLVLRCRESVLDFWVNLTQHDSREYLDSMDPTTGWVGGVGSSNVSIDGWLQATNSSFVGFLGQTIVWNRGLSDAELLAVVNAMRDKWGIT